MSKASQTLREWLQPVVVLLFSAVILWLFGKGVIEFVRWGLKAFGGH